MCSQKKDTQQQHESEKQFSKKCILSDDCGNGFQGNRAAV